jgi:hypothetical protein
MRLPEVQLHNSFQFAGVKRDTKVLAPAFEMPTSQTPRPILENPEDFGHPPRVWGELLA